MFLINNYFSNKTIKKSQHKSAIQTMKKGKFDQKWDRNDRIQTQNKKTYQGAQNRELSLTDAENYFLSKTSTFDDFNRQSMYINSILQPNQELQEVQLFEEHEPGQLRKRNKRKHLNRSKEDNNQGPKIGKLILLVTYIMLLVLISYLVRSFIVTPLENAIKTRKKVHGQQSDQKCVEMPIFNQSKAMKVAKQEVDIESDNGQLYNQKNHDIQKSTNESAQSNDLQVVSNQNSKLLKQKIPIFDKPQFQQNQNQLLQEDYQINNYEDISSLNQLYDCQELCKIYHATQQLTHKLPQTLFRQFNKTPIESANITVVLTTSTSTIKTNKQPTTLQQTIRTFFKYNSYPISKFIVVQDGPLNSQLQDLIKIYQNITWVVTNQKVGQLAAIDIAYQFVQTQYYFHAQDDWVFLDYGFIQFCLHIYAIDSNVSNIWLFKIQQKNVQNSIWKKVTYKQNKFAGYNFNPSLHKFADYEIFQGGFSNLTHYCSYRKGAGYTQLVISLKYLMLGKHTIIANKLFVRHIGTTQQGGQKYHKNLLANTSCSRKLQKIQNQYNQWTKQKRI